MSRAGRLGATRRRRRHISPGGGGAPGGGFLDTFTDVGGTTLAAHPSDTGHVWTLTAGSIPQEPLITAAGTLRSGGNSGSRHQSDFVPDSADYDLDAHIVAKDAANQIISVWGHFFEVGDINGYRMEYGEFNQFRLYKVVAGVATMLGQTGAVVLVVDQIYKMTLRIVANAVSVLVDDVEVIAPVAGDAALAGAGGIALTMRGNFAGVGDAVGTHFTKIEVAA